jgi:hypothetical protein
MPINPREPDLAGGSGGSRPVGRAELLVRVA